MSENIDYAEMLEIPVNTLNVTKQRSRKKKDAEPDLKERVVERVNERVTRGERGEPAYSVAEPEEGTAQGENVVDYGEEAQVFESAPQKPKKFLENKLLLAEFVAVCALCATILLTNLFWQDSAINTFFRGLITPQETVQEDNRVYSELTLGSVVSDAEIECTVSDTGVLTFTGACSVYAPYEGTVKNVAEADGLYTVEIEHTTSFSTVIAGLTHAYFAAGDEVFSTIPVGYTDGASAVSVTMYDAGTPISAYSVSETGDIVWNV